MLSGMVFPINMVMRKIAWLCGMIAAAIIISEYFLPQSVLLWGIVVCGILAVISGFVPLKRRVLIMLVFAGLSLGFARCWVHYRNVMVPSESLYDTDRVINARVIEFPERYDTTDYVVVRLTGDLPAVKCRLTSYDGALRSLEPGDEIRVKVHFRSAMIRYGEETDTYSSKGIFLLGTCLDYPVWQGEWEHSALFAPQRLCRMVTEKSRELFSSDTSPFMTALLSGDKLDLYNDELVYTGLSKAGLSHVVAISGMHISFLMGLLTFLCPNRKRLALMAVPTLLVFCAMIGFTPSVCRAAFMNGYFLLAGILKRENDSPTALAVILALLLLVNPSAAGSVGLQLSFAATAGIVLLSGRIHRSLATPVHERKIPTRLLRKIYMGFAGIAATTFGALIYTIPLTALHFGSVSLLAPVSNLLCLSVVSLLFVGGYISILLGFLLPPFGAFVAGILDWGARYILGVASSVSAVSNSVVYMDHPLSVIWLLLVYAFFIAAYLLRRKTKGYWPIVPVILAVALLLCKNFYLDHSRGEALAVTALDVGQGQCIVLENKEHFVMVDCGSSSSEENVGQLAASYLLSRGIEYVDAAILTHAHRDHMNGMGRFLATVDVGVLILPAETDREDAEVKELLTIARNRGTDIYWLTSDSTWELGEMTLTLWAFDGRASDSEKGLALMAEQDGFEVLVLGDMYDYAEKRLCERLTLPDTEVLVVSHHGSKYSTSEELLEAAQPDIAIISSGYNSYGHPHPEVLKRLYANDVEIHRTDREGTVCIRR